MGFGFGLIHFVPVLCYFGFWIMCLVSLTGRPLLGLYYLMPFVPYRTMRDHFLDYPLGGNALTILVVAVILGALIKGKTLPKSNLYLLWLVFGVYLYFSMWIGTALGNGPAPLWLSDANFVTWKDYMLLPLLFVAAGLVIEDRKAVRTVVLITAISLFLVDKSTITESLSRNMSGFDESKRDSGPLAYGSNQLAAFLAQFAMFFWGFGHFLKRKKAKLLSYGLAAATIFGTMYTFSRGAYLALVVSAIVLALLKNRVLLVLIAVFLFTWQTIVPTAVTQRVSMTKSEDGELEASAQERVDLWAQSQQMFIRSPIVGTGYATFQFGTHTDNLKDTHNWFVKVLVETGLIGGFIVAIMLFQLVAGGFRLFRSAQDPLYAGLGLGFVLTMCCSIITNCFGDRWTYIEITGLLWILAAAVFRAQELAATPASEGEQAATAVMPAFPAMQYR